MSRARREKKKWKREWGVARNEDGSFAYVYLRKFYEPHPTKEQIREWNKALNS